LAGEFHDLRNPTASGSTGLLMFLVAALGLVLMVVLGVKAIDAEGSRRAGLLVLMASVVLVMAAPWPTVQSVTLAEPAIECGHPYLSRPDIDEAARQPATAEAAQLCRDEFSHRRLATAAGLGLAGLGVLVGAVLLVGSRGPSIRSSQPTRDRERTRTRASLDADLRRRRPRQMAGR